MTRPDLEAIEARCKIAGEAQSILGHHAARWADGWPRSEREDVASCVDDVCAALADLDALARYVRELEGRLARANGGEHAM